MLIVHVRKAFLAFLVHGFCGYHVILGMVVCNPKQEVVLVIFGIDV